MQNFSPGAVAGLRPVPTGSVTFAFFTVEELISSAAWCCGTLSETDTVEEESVGPLAAAVTLGAKGTAAQPAIGTGGVVGCGPAVAPAWLSSSSIEVELPLQGLGRVRKSAARALTVEDRGGSRSAAGTLRCC